MTSPETSAQPQARFGSHWRIHLIVLAVAGIIYIGCMVSPPSLMDDVDAVQAQIARTMIRSGDWVTPRLDGIVYLEKPPLIYWLIAGSYKIFGEHDWAARIPMVLACLALCWVTTAFGIWAFSERAGLYAGLTMATCVGLFLFTRVLIPDVMLTFTTALAMWAFMRALDDDEAHPRLWAFIFAASVGVGLLWKSLIAVVFPIAAGVIYLAVTRQLFLRRTWKRLRPFSGAAIALVIAVPWHVLATLRNPPYFVWTLHSGPGQYHGFLWFFFMNEQVLRFLNLRYPRDYNTVPRLYFWMFHLLWLFPWSVYLPAIAKLSFKPTDRAGRTRLIALCWIGFLMVFFTFSTTQEYYSMPAYPAIGLLLGAAMAAGGVWIQRGTRVLCAVAAMAAIIAITCLILVRNVPTPGDISVALTQRLKFYTLSLSHMEDLNLNAMAYLRFPLALAAVSFVMGAIGTFRAPAKRAYLSATLMMVIFFHAARLAMVTFDPYMSSRPLAEALNKSPQGTLIVDHHYYTFSSVFFYADRDALMLNARFNNVEYGSYAPGAPNTFINDFDLIGLWKQPQRYYLVVKQAQMSRLDSLVGHDKLNVVTSSGGKLLLTNHVLTATSP